MAGQTAVNLTTSIAVPGQLADEGLDNIVVSYPAGEAIEFGRLLEASSNGQVFKVRGASATVAAYQGIAGVSVFDVAREQQLATTGGSAGSGFYQSGDMVPVLRRGRIFAAWDGSGSQSVFGSAYVNHPSASDANDVRGVFSNGSVTTTAGSEISALPALFMEIKDVSLKTNSGDPLVCMLEINLPGN